MTSQWRARLGLRLEPLAYEVVAGSRPSKNAYQDCPAGESGRPRPHR